ncbi:hypothetical protein P4S72_00855 [Vibrio sp. PP-XX7]
MNKGKVYLIGAGPGAPGLLACRSEAAPGGVRCGVLRQAGERGNSCLGTGSYSVP